ncbi:hypothetical protein BGW38_006429, partial [Lunasporangiospora selenospora]
MDPNDTIIDIDQHKEDAEIYNSQSEVKRGSKGSHSGTGISAASTSYNTSIDGNSGGPASTSTAHTFIKIIEQTSKPDFGLSLPWDGSQITLICNSICESTTTKYSLPNCEQSA